ncbi:ribonuclease H-like protein [Linderina pennispora]|uniref:Ribonuclease H-like protein n=1 Tax=Linderina pennispora TaxID=61395 RepID=A0A1Y1VY20_9FUNG|nr:ribonuclease H-like protein [Linderina pennispora]ORX65906.1 ribonuclease H-like protein [Linderina pennispora]
MIKNYYAVRVGRIPGVYSDHVAALSQVFQFPHGQMKGFMYLKDAEAFAGIGARSYFPPNQLFIPAWTEAGSYLPIYVYGVCLDHGGNNPQGGCGAYFGYQDSRNTQGIISNQRQTSQRADLWAIYLAIKVVNEEPVPANARRRPLVIYTKSEYAVYCLETGYGEWIQNGWRNSEGSPVANQDVIEAIMAKIRKSGLLVSLRHVYKESFNECLIAARTLAVKVAEDTRKRREEQEVTKVYHVGHCRAVYYDE